jgi:PKD repeat protein
MKKLFIYSCLLLISIGANAQIPNYVPGNGLEGFWTFNGNTNDVSGKGNHGTGSNVVLTTDRAGNPNSAYSFNGISSRIVTTNVPNITGSYTMSAWIYPNNQGNWSSIMDCRPHSNSGGVALLNSFNYFMFITSNNTYSNSSFNINNWIHVVVVYTGSLKLIYINGVLDKSQSQTTSISPTIEPFVFGDRGVISSSPGNYFNGKLDEIGFWNRALTQQEITAYYNQIPISTITLGTAINPYNQYGPGSTRVSYSPEINSVLFVHRGNPAISGQGANNRAYFDYSINGGQSWSTNVGPVLQNNLITGVSSSRYPQGIIYNPTGNTNIANARIFAMGSHSTGQNNFWGTLSVGQCKLDGTNQSDKIFRPGTAYIPQSLTERVIGEYWTVDDTTVDGKITIYKGLYSNLGDSISWSVQFQLPKSRTLFSRLIDGNVHYTSPIIAFSPNGQYGWIATNGEISGSTLDSTLYPIFWSTNNGGLTWSGPQVVRLTSLQNVSAALNGKKPTATIDNDLIVDKNGNPHFVFVVAPKASTPYTYTNPVNVKYPIFNITKQNNNWTAKLIDSVASVNGIYTGTSMSHNNDIMLSRTKDGSKIFYNWVDTEPSLQVTPGINNSPNLYTKGFNVNTNSYSITNCPTRYTSMDGLVYLPNMSEIVSDSVSNGYKLHAVVTSFTGNEGSPVNFIYLNNLYSYTKPNISNSITQNQMVCQGSTPNQLDGNTSSTLQTPTFKWIQSNVSSVANFSDAIGVNNLVNYQPPTIYQNTWYKRIVYIGTYSDTSDTVFIGVYSKTNPKFTISNTNQCLINNQYTFIDSTTKVGSGSIIYSWDFGDGTTSNLKNPIKKYNLSGTYVVRLITYVSQSCKDTFNKTINVYSKQNTVIDVNDTLQFLGNNSFVFNDYSQIQNGSIVNRVWDLGNGSGSLSQNLTMSYSQIGRYKVKLKTISDKGCEDSNYVYVNVLQNPSANFYTQDTSQCLNENLFYFSDSSIVDPLSTNTYSWKFGDGTISSSKNPIKKFNSSGVFQVELKVSSNEKISSSITKSVSVFPKQSSVIKVSNSSQCLNENLFEFNDDSRVSTGTITSRTWDFGDGTTSTSINPIKKYNIIGNYNVKLKTFTNNGCIDSTIKQVSVIKSPLAGSIAGPNTNIQPNTQYLYNINQQLNHTYEWQIENGAIISGQGTNAINIQWLNNGAGVLRCIITSTNNCTDTAKLQLNVGPTGINDIKISNIKIYPNPTNNIINIEGLNKNENNTIQIFDVQGKLVITKNITEKGTVDLSELNKGVYVIKIGELAQRIVKM